MCVVCYYQFLELSYIEEQILLFFVGLYFVVNCDYNECFMYFF